MYIDLDSEKTEASVMIIQTMSGNFEGYTREGVERAIMARKTRVGVGTQVR